jgi:cytoskeletal protein RodZ
LHAQNFVLNFAESLFYIHRHHGFSQNKLKKEKKMTKKHPQIQKVSRLFILIIAVAFLGLWLAACQKSESESTKDADTGAATQEAVDAAQNVADKAAEIKEEAVEASDAAAEAVMEKTEEAADNATEIKEEAIEASDAAAEAVTEKTEEAAEAVHTTAE